VGRGRQAGADTLAR